MVMAEVLRLVHIVLVIILSLQVKKITFVCSDTAGLSIEGKKTDRHPGILYHIELMAVKEWKVYCLPSNREVQCYLHAATLLW